jgi:hypothetical protein
MVMQASLFENPVYPPNPFKIGSQNHRLYERAKLGPITNGEIIYKMRIANSTGRLSEIRAFLAPHGIKLHSERLHDGKWEYRLQ